MKYHSLTLFAASLALATSYASAATTPNSTNLDSLIKQNQNSIAHNSQKIAEYKQDSRKIGSTLLIYGQSNDRRVSKDEALIANNKQAVSNISQKVDAATKQVNVNNQAINKTNQALHSDEQKITSNTQHIARTEHKLASNEQQLQANTHEISQTKQALTPCVRIVVALNPQ
ncbi:hypothetical protein VTH8203_03947 [Vibrio thalassae]|uniref:Chromosome partition protein Smc n=2 Tax=Vibrio thalassae TaxID=1243014 RepID=A0A240ENL3_9VIBR|nr:hypothetical protein VTH8203_03947 [Vibrio thalassae]